MWKHPASLSWDELAHECRETFGRKRGPGGQHRNKVETAVMIEHLPTGIRAEASERRSQAENRRVARVRLRRALALGVRGSCSGATAERVRHLEPYLRRGRMEIAESNDEFPSVLAIVFDTLDEHNYEVGKTAEALGMSTAQLVRFLRKHRDAWQQVNEARMQRGLKPLRNR